MSTAGARSIGHIIRDRIRPLTGSPADYDPLLERIGDARFVLLGEASHGTHEFYRERAEITRRLIREYGFGAVAVEADWPDAYRVNRFVRGEGADGSATDALGDFVRFPVWMWRNAAVRDFVDWLRAHNDGVDDEARRVGFYGLDLYSLFASMGAVLDYLDRVDPDAAERARFRYGCFDHAGEDPQTYGYTASIGTSRSCEDAVVGQLVELRRLATAYARRDGLSAEDEFFFAEQNARLAKNSEAYYRTLFEGGASSWNLRDRHMAETLDALAAHLERTGRPGKVVVWAHNSHLGDARATEMGRGGELNLGQLVREKYGEAAVLVGFTTYTGTVTAATGWDRPAERMQVRPALPGSFEAGFHEAETPAFLLVPRDDAEMTGTLFEERLERAIGVVYRPETERASHYFGASIAAQFDAVLHFDETRAVEPLEPGPGWTRGPETFPTGL